MRTVLKQPYIKIA